MEIFGYKCFNKDLTNNYGKKFSVGKIYITSGAIKFGNNGNGFHLCKNIEDTFRYFDTEEGVNICEVIGRGNYKKYNDNYNGYYDMYCVEQLEILKLLSREEIINIGLNLTDIRALRFVSTFHLTEEEINLFKEKYKDSTSVLDAIAYHRENDKDVYYRKYR